VKKLFILLVVLVGVVNLCLIFYEYFDVSNIKAPIENGIHTKYYKSGDLMSEIPYVNGKRHGQLKTYYKDGSNWIESFVVEGKQHGTRKVYYQNGNIERETKKDMGKMIWEKKYNKNGVIKDELVYKDGKISVLKTFDEKGNLTLEKRF